MSCDLSIIMYHYIREPALTRYPRIKGLTTCGFRRQLALLRRDYHLVTVAQVVHSVRTGEALPPNAALLTFDDGYIEHYTTVFPILFDAGVQGAFFPPVGAVQRGELLNVNRVHFLLAVGNAAELGREIDRAVEEHRDEFGLRASANYRAEWEKPNRFDSGDVIYVKRMLQVALPEPLRTRIAQDLFARHVGVEERAFAAELYVVPEQLKLMQASGMYVGSHGDAHYWLDACDDSTQQREITTSIGFLREIGSPVDDFWVMCYPYGAWDERLLQKLRMSGCSLGLTTRVARAELGSDDPLLLPRFDTNDLEQ